MDYIAKIMELLQKATNQELESLFHLIRAYIERKNK